MIRVGGLYYANALPFFYPLFSNIIPHNADFTWGTPKQINRLLSEEKLDLAMVSSLTFIDNRSNFVLLSDMGIAARNLVESVCLFIPKECKEEDFSEIYITKESETSARLLEVLCHNFWNIFPKFTIKDTSNQTLIQEKKLFLSIGDQCLALLDTPGYMQIDLAKAWNMATGKGFIFGLLVTNNSSLQKKSEEIFEFHKAIDMAFQWSQENISEIIRYAHSQIPNVSCDFFHSYFTKSLEYRLSTIHFQGLEYFSQLENRVLTQNTTPQLPLSNFIKIFFEKN